MDNEKIYNIDRKAASRLLKVSIRTVDRYIKSKKLSTQVVGGKVWLNKAEIADFYGRQGRQAVVDKVDVSTSNLSIDNRVDNVDKGVDIGVDNVDNFGNTVDSGTTVISDTIISGKRRKTGGEGVYKKLYEELKQDVKEGQTRLEIANYRVGQLEAQVKNSIPLLEYHQQTYEKNLQEQKLKKDLEERETLLQKVLRELKVTKVNKRIFLLILLLIIALQPLWLLLIYKS